MSWLFPDISGLATSHADAALKFHHLADEAERPDIDRWQKIKALRSKKRLTKKQSDDLKFLIMLEQSQQGRARICRSIAYEQENMMERLLS